MKRVKQAWLMTTCGVLMALAVAAPVRAQAGDPLFLYVPPPPLPLPKPPPTGDFNGPCGIGVSAAGNLYVSDYYHHTIDMFDATPNYLGQIANEDPLDGPCGLSFGAANALYVNNYHRNVVRFSAFSLAAGSVLTGAPLDSARPAGVAVDKATGRVYVNDRTYIAVFDSAGNPVLDEGEPLKIGLGSLTDAYGIALSQFPGSYERIYVPDAGSNTVKVYEPATSTTTPIAEIERPGGFTSLRDSAIAVDDSTGEIYVVDNLQPSFTERPQASVFVFEYAGAYEGHLKFNIVDALPPGLAVDNSGGVNQGRVYVTTGNGPKAGVYGYPPDSAITGPGLPATFHLGVATSGSGSGLVRSTTAGVECSGDCESELLAGSRVTLEATPDPGSSFAGWTGGDCAGTVTCTVSMSGARSIEARFEVEDPRQARAIEEARASEVTQHDNLRLNVDGRLSPKSLPRTGLAPIAVSVDWTIATVDGSTPPKLKKLRIEINRNGHFDSTGLPVCPTDRIQPASTARALANCRSALVGQGRFTAIVGLREQEPYETSGRLLVFNGLRKGKPVLLGQIYSAHPFPTSFVIPFTLKELGKGTYGTVLEATLPPTMAAWGNLTGIDMKLSRRYGYDGERRSYVSAACPVPQGFSRAVFPLSRETFKFEDGSTLSSVLTSTCSARR